MEPKSKKRQMDANAIAQWVNEGDRVLDLGCGRGVLLEYLKQKKSVNGIGVDINFEYILSCVRRGVTAYHGDIRQLLATFEDNTFDRVIFSRSVEFVNDPEIILTEGLRVGKRVTVGFLNQGFWKNRVKFLFKGQLAIKYMQQRAWYETQPSNPFSVSEFDEFCNLRKIRIENRTCLSGDMQSECTNWPNLFASYAIYDLTKNQDET
ncbi:MAG: methionine biosynthesis protein MetW [Lentimonas sp.]|jgi:methionine biosynthesis protein MetW